MEWTSLVEEKDIINELVKLRRDHHKDDQTHENALRVGKLLLSFTRRGFFPVSVYTAPEISTPFYNIFESLCDLVGLPYHYHEQLMDDMLDEEIENGRITLDFGLDPKSLTTMRKVISLLEN